LAQGTALAAQPEFQVWLTAMAINIYRSERKCTEYFSGSTTHEKVGPGTYSNTHNEPAPPHPEKGVPFASLQEKELNHNKGTSAITPGPGAYVEPGEIVKAGADGTVNFKSRAKRMAPTAPGSSAFLPSTILQNPGPGTHDINTSWTSPKKERPDKAPPVLEMRQTVPSIPIQKVQPGSTDGRATDPDMSAVKVKYTGEGEDKVGPGEYTLGGEKVLHPVAPSASRWAISSSNRKLFEPSCAIDNGLPSRNNPGPGSYNSRKPPDPESSKDATFQFASKTPMGYQKVTKEKAAAPGPGAYMSDVSKEIMNKDNNQFGSTVARGGWDRPLNQPFTDPYNRSVVGPGHYPEPKSCFVTPRKNDTAATDAAINKQKFHGVHHPNQIMALQEAAGPLHAFCSTDIRPCNKKVGQATPAPGQYNNEDSLGFSISAIVKERATVGKKGVFGTTADRFHGSQLAPKDGIDPGKYDNDHGKYEEAPRSMFQSQSARFNKNPPREVYATMVGKRQTPGPADYVTDKTVNYRSPFRHPRTDHLSFSSGRNRFDTKEIFCGQNYNLNPGPGDYEASRRGRSLPGAAKTQSQRLQRKDGGTAKDVGPGSYNIEGTMLKKTFNVSTEAPIPLGSKTAR